MIDPTVRSALETNIHQARQYAQAAATALAYDDRRLGDVPDDELLQEATHAARCCVGVGQLLSLGVAGEAFDPNGLSQADRQDSAEFFDLLKRFPLKGLESTKDIAAARRVRDALVAREPLGPSATVYVAALCELICAYEAGHRPSKRRPFTVPRSR